MATADQEFGLHLNKREFSSVGGTPHYFKVNDVDSRHRGIVERGGTPTEISNLPWIGLSSVTDQGVVLEQPFFEGIRNLVCNTL